MVAGFIWLSYHPTDSSPRCQDAMIQTGMFQGSSLWVCRKTVDRGFAATKASENSILSFPHTLPFLSGVSGDSMNTVKVLGWGSCQYLKMEVEW